MFKRGILKTLTQRLSTTRPFIQVLTGPRQVGKTTLARQAMERLKKPCHYASADEPGLRESAWLETQWEIARTKTQSQGAVLILDEIQKISDWPRLVKKLWDADTLNHVPLAVVLLGSAPLLLQQGLTESLAGRFENIPVTHWTFHEMNKAFQWDLETYCYFGGYPGAASLIEDETRWSRYISDALIETTLSRDILLMTRIHKPALLRRLFQLGCEYSGQILSYQKMIGQLDDAGNTTTLAHYLELLSSAGMVSGIFKYTGKALQRRTSSPKLQVFNTALLSAQSGLSFRETKENKQRWGRWIESTVGAHLVNQCIGTAIEIYYWREGNEEVDFILRLGKKLIAIEVKSGLNKKAPSGLHAFNLAHHPYRMLLIGQGGISLENFLKTPVLKWFE